MLFFAEPLLAQVAAKARELDTSLSWVLQRAWQVGGSRIEGVRLGELVQARRVRESLYLLTDQWAEIKERAARDDTSMSSLVQRALVVALPELRR